MVLDRLGSKNSAKTWKKSQPALRSSQLCHRQLGRPAVYKSCTKCYDRLWVWREGCSQLCKRLAKWNRGEFAKRSPCMV